MRDFTVVVPYWNGSRYIKRLVNTIPEQIPVLIVDDQSDDTVPNLNRSNTRVVRLVDRGYFAGAVNAGIDMLSTDALVLNQDAYFESERWINFISEHQSKYAIFGDGVLKHPAWPRGYVQGTFMYIDREAWDCVGAMNGRDYPLWGCTAEWQLRACRFGYSAKPVEDVPGLVHAEHRRVRWGEAITQAVVREPEKRRWFIRTPPMVSVIVPCYNYANYLPQAIASLVGGKTDLGMWDVPGQSFQSFEVIIVDDASPDNTPKVGKQLADRAKGIRYVRLSENRGTAGAINAGIERAFGEYIHVLSADDLRRPFTLERLLAGCKGNEHSVAYGDIDVFRSGKIVKRIKMHKYDFNRMLHKNMMPAGIMYPRQAWEDAGGYPDLMDDGREDWAFNVALGINGWCGIHIGFSGNLVRREGTNRSIATAQQYGNARAHFKKKIMGIFPEIYGGKRPVGCCGKGSTGGNSKGMPKYSPTKTSGDMVLVEYIGGNVGVMTWDAPSGNRYRFGGSRNEGYVHSEDASWFLNMRKNTKPLFRVVEEPELEPELVEDEPLEAKDLTGKSVSVEQDLTMIKGVAETTAEKLKSGGYLTVEEVAEADPQEMAELTGISSGYAERHIEGARRVLA